MNITTSCSKGVFQYYIRKSKDKSHKGKYISSKNKAIIQKLIQLDYNKKVLKACKSQLSSINKLLKAKNSVENVYQKLPEGKQILANPVTLPDKLYAKNWIAQPYTPKAFSPNDPEFYTASGLRVRSKSEIIIATILEKLHIPYRYEYPIQAGNIVLHPDFYCLNLRNRQEFIWEHFGMIDDPHYAENFANKMQVYNNNEYFAGKNLILTFESKNVPLNSKTVEKLAKHYLA